MSKELIKKSPADLKKELEGKRVALRDLRFGIAGSKGKNVKEYANLKKEIARIETILNQKINNE
jgi:ribosomal protein L29